MTNGASSTTRERASLREIAAFAGAVALVFTLVLAVTRSFVIVSRAPWADEVDTLLFASDPSLGHALRGLMQGYDTSPPLMHLWLWLYSRVVPVSPAALRIPSFCAVVAGWSACYATLRYAYGRAVSAAATLTSLPAILLVYHCFEARFYGYWFGGTAVVAYVIARRQERSTTRNAAGLALVSLAVATLHYLGVVTVGLAALGDLALGPGALRDRFRRVLPTAAALAGFAVDLPIYLVQRSHYTVASWVPKPTLPGMVEFLYPLFTWPMRLFACAIVAAALSLAIRRGSAPLRPDADERAARRRVAPLAVLALAPLVFVVVSFVFIPACVPRYGVVFFAGFPAVAAFVLARAHRLGAVAVAALSVLAFAHNVPKLAATDREFDAQAARFAAIATENAPRGPVVFHRPFYTYPVWFNHPELRDRVFTWDFEPAATPSFTFTSFDRFARDLNRGLVAGADGPKMMRIEALDTGGAFLWIASLRPEQNALLFPRHACVAGEKADGVFDPGLLYAREPLVVYRCAPAASAAQAASGR